MDEKRTYLAIPYEQRNEAFKVAGKNPDGSNVLEFDDENGVWFAQGQQIKDGLKGWLPRDVTSSSKTVAADPITEFHSVLTNAGLVLEGMPLMDGKLHRVKVEDDKRGQTSGVYKAFLDGRPAGWYQNHKHDEDIVKWKAIGEAIDKSDLDNLKAIAAQKKYDRSKALVASYQHHARRCARLYDLLPDHQKNVSHQYLDDKGISAHPGVKVDKKNRLVVPLYNSENQITTVQRISENGFKSLKKNAKKSGSFFVVGSNKINSSGPILYAEGYSTASSIFEATGRPVVMTIDAGNMPTVAKIMKAKYPEKEHIFLADNDHAKDVNKGLIKAKQSAEITGGKYITPDFTGDELKQGFTDFNDLHSSRGIEAIATQVNSLIGETSMSENDNVSDVNDFQDELDEANYENAQASEQHIEGDEVEENFFNSIELPEEQISDLAEQPILEQSSETAVQRAVHQQQIAPSNEKTENEKKPTEYTDSETVFHKSSDYVELNGKYYFRNSPDKLAFVDAGRRLKTNLNDRAVAVSMVSLAEEKQWDSLKVKGLKEFRRNIWLEGNVRGLVVHGYTPSDADLAALKALAQRMPNVSAENAGATDNISGTLLAHGEAPYKHKKGGSKSYYVTVKNSNGKDHTYWGVDLKRAMKESGAEIGQNLEVRQIGKQPVTIDVPKKDSKGKLIGSEKKEVMRNSWEVKAEALRDQARSPEDVVNEFPELVNEVAVVKMAERFSEKKLPAEAQQKFVGVVKGKLADSVEKGKNIPPVTITNRDRDRSRTQEEELER
jgi:phage/plasmid primase-like uncharacterized protein